MLEITGYLKDSPEAKEAAKKAADIKAFVCKGGCPHYAGVKVLPKPLACGRNNPNQNTCSVRVKCWACGGQWIRPVQSGDYTGCPRFMRKQQRKAKVGDCKTD